MARFDDAYFYTMLACFEPLNGISTKWKEFEKYFKKNYVWGHGGLNALKDDMELFHDKLLKDIRKNSSFAVFQKSTTKELFLLINEQLKVEAQETLQFEELEETSDLTAPMDPPPQYFKLFKHELYLERNANKVFVSLDLKSANFNVLRLINPAIVFHAKTWEDLIDDSSPASFILRNSKHMRVRLLGKLTPMKIAALEAHLLDLIYLVCYFLCSSNAFIRRLIKIIPR
jgi:hypothetical protein